VGSLPTRLPKHSHAARGLTHINTTISRSTSMDCTFKLQRLAAPSENAVTIVTAGAIPLLAQSRIGADDDTKAAATRALETIRSGIAANRAAAAAAKASADMVQAMKGLGVDSPPGAQTP
jgi:hypothetical protein